MSFANRNPETGFLWIRSATEQQRIQTALGFVRDQAQEYANAAYPKPFGALQATIVAAKHAGATCAELRTVLRGNPTRRQKDATSRP